MGNQTEQDALEELRKKIVHSMCVGDNLLVDVDKLAVDFKTKFSDESVLDTSVFFDFEESHKEANYLKIVKESENHGPGGLNPGHFML